MSSYSELVKNFEKIRAYMREFYVYGFKSRDEYDKKSARSYDDERRRMESLLGDHMGFVRTPEGKNVFISIDSRTSAHNPLYRAWKAKSFTDGDITLHFILLDILYAPEVALSLAEIMRRIDKDYLCQFNGARLFDESTVRKKLKEYAALGIINAEKQGKTAVYHRAAMKGMPGDADMLHFFSEVAPCGVIGSFLLDKIPRHDDHFAFKHHYITAALDSEVAAALFLAMREQRAVSASYVNVRTGGERRVRFVPLRVFISVQSGRAHVLAYRPEQDRIAPFRIDCLSDVTAEDTAPRFSVLRARLDSMMAHIWGVNCGRRPGRSPTEHVEFDVRIGRGEEHIIRRLEREKRIGHVDKIDDVTYRFSADVYDSTELVPWIRTFICRIVRMNFSNRTVENGFKQDIETMCRLYGIEETEGNA